MMDNIHKSNCDNTTSVANEYVVDKLVEVATLFGRRQEQGMCVSDNAVKTSKELDKYKVWYAEKANHLATANAEIERLKGVCTLYSEKLSTMITEHEAEANSYRDLYNELKCKVIGDNPTFTSSDVLSKVDDFHGNLKLYDTLRDLLDEAGYDHISFLENKINSLIGDRETCSKDAEYQNERAGCFERKYNRLVDIINKNKECYGGSILTAHRDNEAELKAKRGK